MTMAALETQSAASRLTVRPSVVDDIYKLAAKLRQEDREEVEALGVDVRLGLRRSFRHAILRKTYFIDGELAAMSGLCGAMLGDIGEPYFLTGPAVERIPVAVVRQARESVREMLSHKRLLEGYVAANYVRAGRMLEMIGFTLGAPQPLGPKATPFRRYSMMRAA